MKKKYAVCQKLCFPHVFWAVLKISNGNICCRAKSRLTKSQPYSWYLPQNELIFYSTQIKHTNDYGKNEENKKAVLEARELLKAIDRRELWTLIAVVKRVSVSICKYISWV